MYVCMYVSPMTGGLGQISPDIKYHVMGLAEGI